MAGLSNRVADVRNDPEALPAKAQVVIVGYGPVGQLLALLLGRQGREIVVVERWASLFAMPRAVHYDHEVARIFQSAGVIGPMQAISGTAEEVQFLGAQRQLLFKFGVSGWSQSGWPFANGFAQPDLEAVLDEAVRALPNVKIMRGWQADAVDQSPEGAQLTVRRGGLVDGGWAPDGATHAIGADFVIGTDGANSFLRRQMATEFTDLGFEFDWLVVNVRWKPGHERDFGIQNICDPARPTSVVPGGPGRRRWEFMLVPGDDPQHLSTVEAAWKLLEPWDVHPGNAILERHAIYTFRAGWAEQWRDGRLLLAGDSAHLMPPFMGQGMCSGMRDAMTLAWQLGTVLDGIQPLAFLDNYGEERLGHVKYLIHGSVEHGKIICLSDPVAAAERDARMQAAALDPAMAPPPPAPPRLGGGITMAGNPFAGLLSFQGLVEKGGRRGLFDDVVGRGFTLVGAAVDPAEHLNEINRAFLDSIGATVANIAADTEVRDVDDGYAKFFAGEGYKIALSRPDFYLFGAVANVDELNPMIDALRMAWLAKPLSEPDDRRSMYRNG